MKSQSIYLQDITAMSLFLCNRKLPLIEIPEESFYDFFVFCPYNNNVQTRLPPLLFSFHKSEDATRYFN